MLSEPTVTQNETNPRIVIFGAGQGGVCAYGHLQAQYEVLGFCDNDTNKQGSRLLDLPIYSPVELANLCLDKVIVASEYFEQIYQQLNDLNPDFEIEIAPSRLTRALQLGQSTEIQHAAIQVLLTICHELNNTGINYYVDAGTLLGIYRDNALIPWDDDLDIALDANCLEQGIAYIDALLPTLESLTGSTWQLQQFICDTPYGAVPKGAVRTLKLIPEKSSLPIVDFFIKYIDGDVMDYCLASRGIRMPSEHFDGLQRYEFANGEVQIPAKVELYLQRHYGDWQTPKKEWSLSELQNATVF